MSCIKTRRLPLWPERLISFTFLKFIQTVCTWYCLILTECDCVFIIDTRLNKLCGSNNINLKYATLLIIIMDKLKQQIF